MGPFISNFFEEKLWLHYALVLLISIVLGIVLRWIIFSVFRFYNRKSPTVLKEQLPWHLKTPSLGLLPLLFVYSALPYFELGIFWHKFMEALIISNLAWILIAFLGVVEEMVKRSFQIDGNHRAKERKVLTQLRFVKSIIFVIIITLAVATILWNIPAARELGKTILTSAGVIGIIVGVAAQKSIANLITGFQLAFTQSIKIDDEVVVEGEFGTVEDVTLTYVVIKTWDWRRLVLPLNYFNDKPFVNWTFNSRPLIASVYLHLDYTFPVAELRTKLMHILKDNPLWDKNIAELSVTDTDNRTMEIRASLSVQNHKCLGLAMPCKGRANCVHTNKPSRFTAQITKDGCRGSIIKPPWTLSPSVCLR